MTLNYLWNVDVLTGVCFMSKSVICKFSKFPCFNGTLFSISRICLANV